MNCLMWSETGLALGHHVIPRNGDAHFFTVAQLTLGISGVSFGSLSGPKKRGPERLTGSGPLGQLAR